MTAIPLLAEFERVCARWPQRQALILGSTPYSYEQISRRAAAWHADMRAAGLAQRDRIVVALHDRLEFVAVWFATWQLGAIPIPSDTAAAPAELERVLAASSAMWVLSDTPALLAALPATHRQPSALQPGCAYVRCATEVVAPLPDDTALLFYTSGTTGLPKCVAHGHRGMAANVLSLAERLELSERDVVLTPLALALPATLATVTLPALCRGATLALPDRPIPGQVLRKIIDTDATIFFAVPYFYELLCSGGSSRRGDAWNGVRLCLSSSAERSANLFDRFYALTGRPIRSAYCTSEAGACTFNDSRDVACVRAAVGRPLSGVALRIVDDAGCPLPTGHEGQIQVGGAHVALGYVGQPDLQAAVFSGGWVLTGDVGQLDADGYLHLIGRQSDTINVSGFLVQPREVEETLLAHPAVVEALVYGQPDPKLGELVAAQVMLRADAMAPPKELLFRHCAATLPHYKVPRAITFVDQLPKGRYDKIKRPHRAEAYEERV